MVFTLFSGCPTLVAFCHLFDVGVSGIRFCDIKSRVKWKIDLDHQEINIRRPSAWKTLQLETDEWILNK